MKLITMVTVWVLFLGSLPASAENQHFAPLQHHTGNVVSARFTPDSKHTLSVDDDGALIEWDFINKRIQRRVQAPFATTKAGLSSYAATAVFLGKGGEVARYELTTGRFSDIDTAKLRKTEDVDEWRNIAISPDATVVFISDAKGRIFRSLSGRPFTPFRLNGLAHGGKRLVSALAVSPDSTKLAIGEQGMIRIVDAGSGEPVWQIPHDRISYSFSLTFSPDSKFITAGIPGVITLNHSQQEMAVWEIEGGRKKLAVSSPDGVASAGGFSHDGKLTLLAFSSNAQIYDLATGRQVGRSFKATRKRAELYFQMDMSPDGKYILISGRNGLLKVYETARIISDKIPVEFASLDNVQ